METDQNEQLKNLVHKKLCEIVEAGSSAAMTWPQFEDYCRYFDLASYKNLSEELFIAGRCGYAPCGQRVETAPPPAKKRLRYSQKTIIAKTQYKLVCNRVYDISERHWFCSDACFAKYVFVQNQLPTEPIWITGLTQPTIRINQPTDEKPAPGYLVTFPTDVIAASTEESEKTRAQLKETLQNNQQKLPTAMENSPMAAAGVDDLTKVLKRLSTKNATAKKTTSEKIKNIEIAPLAQAPPRRPIDEGANSCDLSQSDMCSSLIDVLRAWNAGDAVAAVRSTRTLPKDADEKKMKRTVTSKIEAAEQTRKVQEFYSGSKKVVGFEDDESRMETESTCSLQPIDSHDQHKWRVQIVMQKLSPTWHALELPLSYQNELHRFMNACTLDAANILFPSVRHTKLLAVATAMLISTQSPTDQVLPLTVFNRFLFDNQFNVTFERLLQIINMFA